MRHLSTEELVDLAEGVRSASSSHAEACESCRRQIAELRATMLAAVDVEVPEPSPLFWDHFSARVHDAVATEGIPTRVSRVFWLDAIGRGGILGGWRSGAMSAVAAAALGAVVIALVLQSDVDVRPGTGAQPATAEAVIVPGPESSEPLADDPSLALVGDLAAELDWDSVGAAGLAVELGGADSTLNQLTANERVELDRLLKEVLAKPGA